jgi:hypothetical protein
MEHFCVESRSDEVHGIVPERIGFPGAMHEVVEILDQWRGDDHSYFRVRTADAAHFLVRLDELAHRWSLVLFTAHGESPPPEGAG